ncbi:MAG: hemerythrin domain-containing protein [Egibacteraceae bacterium]
MDAIEALTEDHRAVNRAFLQYEDLAPGAAADRREAVEEIKRRLAWHAATEQQFLHPLIIEVVPDGQGWIANEINGLRGITGMLRALAMSPVESDAFDAQVRELIVHVRQHMESEEQSLFPLLRGVVDRARLTELGNAINTARDAERSTTPVA